MNLKVVGEGVDLLAVEGSLPVVEVKSLRGVAEGSRDRAEAAEVRKSSQRRLALLAKHWHGHLGDVDPLNCPSADGLQGLAKIVRGFTCI